MALDRLYDPQGIQEFFYHIKPSFRGKQKDGAKTHLRRRWFMSEKLTHTKPEHKQNLCPEPFLHATDWISHKQATLAVADLYRSSPKHSRRADRMNSCAAYLNIAELIDADCGEVILTPVGGNFCDERNCPLCQWRRALRWRARLIQALPSLLEQHKNARFVLLTLTVQNCSITELRATLLAMSAGWKRLADNHQKVFKGVVGWVKTVEVTRADDTAHPHLHCLLMVQPSFLARGPMTEEPLQSAWRQALGVDYDPLVNVQKISRNMGPVAALRYTMKPKEMLASPQWFITFTEQMSGLRYVDTGGIFRGLLRSVKKPRPSPESTNNLIRLVWDSGRGEYAAH